MCSTRRFSLLMMLALAAPGCHQEKKIDFSKQSATPSVNLIHPTMRTITRVVGQPSFIESYERTSIYPKVTGFIEKWNVDIGDKVKKGQLLATLFVPELVEDFGTKNATVELDKQRINLALQVVEVVSADVAAAEARLTEAKAILAKFQAEVERWATEVSRLGREVKRGVVDPQVLLESENQLKSSTASRDAAEAAIARAKAELLSKQSSLAKAKVDVSVARADLSVADSESRRLKAWVGYLKLTAPFDGVIVARNANTFDFVTPSAGDPTATGRSPDLSPGKAAPIYVVDRTDIVRVFVDVPEHDANYVTVGTKASVLARAYRDDEIQANVTRTSWSLNVKSRTLRAEIDLPNTRSQILPGMYAYANVIIERPDVRSLPVEALVQSGDQTFIWEYKDGKAVRTEVETGVSDGQWIEITNCRKTGHDTKSARRTSWAHVNGSEQVIVGDLTALSDGERVKVVLEKDVATVGNAKSTRPDTDSD